MTTTVKALGGGAQPASIDTSGKVAGGAALRVYGFASEADAIAAGYVCEGGPAMSVSLITDAQIASGAWKAEGDPSALVVYTAPSNMPVEGGYALPVYSVNGWGSAAPVPVPPLFDSAEVGNVNASTVAVTFDQDVSASDYKAGVTIKVNGSGATISSATRQSNHAIVYYVLSAAVVFGDTVTWEYVEASGNIVAEDDSTPLANVSAQSVTNNVAYDIGTALRADAKAYYKLNSDGSDATGRGNTASNVGTVTYVAGHIGNAAHFSSVDDAYLSAASSPDLKMTSTDFHIAFWVKLLAKPPGGCGVLTKGESTAFEYGTFYESLDEFGFVADGGDTVFADSLGSPNVGTWYFLEVQWESSTSTPRISINDAVFDDYGSSAALIPNNDPLIIGGQIDPLNTPNIIDCDIQHIGIWHRFLTQDERDYLYNGGTGRTLYP